MANRRLHLPLLATALVAAPLCAAGGLKPLAPASLAQIHSQESLRATPPQDRLMGLRGQFGMDADGAFAPARVYTDAFGETHARFNQLYRGVKVWNGEINAAANAVRFTHFSPEGEMGFPGNVEFTATYRLHGNRLKLELTGKPERRTPLAGHFLFDPAVQRNELPDEIVIGK